MTSPASAAGSSTRSRRTRSRSSRSSRSSRRSGRRDGRVRRDLRLRAPRRAARDRRRQARRRRLDRARLLRPPTSRAPTPPADALTVNPWLGRESIEPYLAAARRNGDGHLLHRQDVERGRRRPGLTLSDGRPVWQQRRRARRRVGRRPRRRTRPLGGRRGRRRDPSARRQRGAQADAAVDPAAAGRRRAGREAGRPRPGVHERPGERARQRVALGQLRVPRGRAATSGPRRARRPPGCADEIWNVSGW